MSDIKQILRVCKIQMKGWLSNPRIYIAFFIGIVLSVMDASRYYDYTVYYGAPMNILEPYIFTTSSQFSTVLLALGMALLLSDAPFADQSTTYSIYRTGRNNWVLGKVLYVVASAALYNLAVFLSGALYVLNNAFFSDFWSEPLYVLAVKPPAYVATRFSGLGFPFPNLLSSMPPVTAALQAFLLAVLYSCVLGLILFLVNLNSGRIWGFVAMMAVHGGGYLIFSIGFFGPGALLHLSLLGQSMLSLHEFKSFSGDVNHPGLPESYLIFIVLITALIFLTTRAIRRFDFKITVGTKA